MPCMGPEPVTDEEVDIALSFVLNALFENCGCNFIVTKTNSANWKKLRKKRIAKLRKAVYKMLELERWESF